MQTVLTEMAEVAPLVPGDSTDAFDEENNETCTRIMNPVAGIFLFFVVLSFYYWVFSNMVE